MAIGPEMEVLLLVIGSGMEGEVVTIGPGMEVVLVTIGPRIEVVLSSICTIGSSKGTDTGIQYVHILFSMCP